MYGSTIETHGALVAKVIMDGSLPDPETLMSGDGDDVILEGERITLTPLRFENIYKHFEWNNDPELNRLDNELPFRKEAFGEFKERFEQMVFRPVPQSFDFEVHTEDGDLIGVAYAVDVSTDHRHCTVGVTIGDREFWGKGYGRASLDLLLAFCFNDLGMHRVRTETFEYNQAWRSLVEDAGFRKEGVERDYLYRDDRYWNKEVYALLKDEYTTSDAPRGPDDLPSAD